MIITVFSDLHGDSDKHMEEAFETSDYVIFLGDGLQRILGFEYEHPGKFLYVRGNCDLWDSTPTKRIIDLDGVRILATHGHEQHVKTGVLWLLREAKEEGIDIVLFGHTHRAIVEKVDDILFVNPGSASRQYGGKASAAKITIENGRYFAEIINFD
ncbi:MAG: YfcE family phosphodiesterase [Clostridia bacterium]|nr:YfcE family phosphodiesterase [Clostridia bacterium]